MLSAALSGCAGNPAAEQSSGEANAPNISEADQQKAAEDLEKALDAIAVKGWPKDKLPSELPEYTEGEIINSGGDSETFYVKIEKTTQAALDNYVAKLKASGWNVVEGSEPEARKGIYDIEFTWQGGSTMLQMAVNTSEIGAWPKDKLPAEIVPPENSTFIGKVEIIETEENRMWYFNYECEGINEAGAHAYMELLMKNGWSGDTSMVNKDFQWNGKKYSASIEIYEILDSSTTFTCNYYIAE